jgi:hypothetical protein
MTMPIVDRAGLTHEQFDLIQQFEADYNAIDHFLRKAFSSDKQISFTHLVNEYSRRHAGWHDADPLKTIADVRNAIVHGKTEAYLYVAVPTPAIAQNLKACRDRLINPGRVIPKFQRKVERVSSSDSLGRVLRIIAKQDYSRTMSPFEPPKRPGERVGAPHDRFGVGGDKSVINSYGETALARSFLCQTTCSTRPTRKTQDAVPASATPVRIAKAQ